MKSREFKKLKQGSEVRISKRYLKFWDRHAQSLCQRPSGKMSPEDHLEYLLRKSLGRGCPYKAEVLHTQTCEPKGGAKLKISLTPDHFFTSIIPKKDLRLKK